MGEVIYLSTPEEIEAGWRAAPETRDPKLTKAIQMFWALGYHGAIRLPGVEFRLCEELAYELGSCYAADKDCRQIAYELRRGLMAAGLISWGQFDEVLRVLPRREPGGVA